MLLYKTEHEDAINSESETPVQLGTNARLTSPLQPTQPVFPPGLHSEVAKRTHIARISQCRDVQRRIAGHRVYVNELRERQGEMMRIIEEPAPLRPGREMRDGYEGNEERKRRSPWRMFSRNSTAARKEWLQAASARYGHLPDLETSSHLQQHRRQGRRGFNSSLMPIPKAMRPLAYEQHRVSLIEDEMNRGSGNGERLDENSEQNNGTVMGCYAIRRRTMERMGGELEGEEWIEPPATIDEETEPLLGCGSESGSGALIHKKKCEGSIQKIWNMMRMRPLNDAKKSRLPVPTNSGQSSRRSYLPQVDGKEIGNSPPKQTTPIDTENKDSSQAVNTPLSIKNAPKTFPPTRRAAKVRPSLPPEWTNQNSNPFQKPTQTYRPTGKGEGKQRPIARQPTGHPQHQNPIPPRHTQDTPFPTHIQRYSYPHPPDSQKARQDSAFKPPSPPAQQTSSPSKPVIHNPPPHFRPSPPSTLPSHNSRPTSQPVPLIPKSSTFPISSLITPSVQALLEAVDRDAAELRASQGVDVYMPQLPNSRSLQDLRVRCGQRLDAVAREAGEEARAEIETWRQRRKLRKRSVSDEQIHATSDAQIPCSDATPNLSENEMQHRTIVHNEHDESCFSNTSRIPLRASVATPISLRTPGTNKLQKPRKIDLDAGDLGT